MSGSGTAADPYICIKSEDSSDGNYTREYLVIGPLSMSDAFAALLSDLVQAPLTHPDDANLNRQIPSGSEDEDSPYHYDLTIEYKPDYPPSTPLDGDEFLIPGASITHTVKQKQAFSVIDSYAAPGETPIETYAMINATKDGVEGIDEEEPGFGFGLRVRMTKGTIDIGLMATVAGYCKRVNSQPWRGWAAGEVYFKDYSFDNNDEDWDYAELYFEISPNATNIVLPSPWGNITIAVKAGWDYLNISYVDDPNGRPFKVPHTASVMRTKKFIDLNGLI